MTDALQSKKGRRESDVGLKSEEFPFFRPSMFWTPLRLAPSAWIEHIPFAFWLVDVMRPRTVVELGVHNGVSYSAFCQAVKQLDIDARCFAVDTWRGDEHAGFYSEEIFNDLSRFNEDNFHGFSTLIRSTFDQAVDKFEDNSIDILHIDGLHSFDAVKSDYDTWAPKLSERSVVLLHDTAEHQDGFEVYKFWNTLQQTLPNFEFFHGHGLGVAGFGSTLTEPLKDLFQAQRHKEQAEAIREAFARVGRTTQIEYDNSVLTERLEGRQNPVRESSELGYIISQVSSMRSSIGDLPAVRASVDQLLQGSTEQHSALVSVRAPVDQILQNSTELQAALTSVQTEIASTKEIVEDSATLRATVDQLLQSSTQLQSALTSARAEIASTKELVEGTVTLRASVDKLLRESTELRSTLASVQTEISSTRECVEALRISRNSRMRFKMPSLTGEEAIRTRRNIFSLLRHPFNAKKRRKWRNKQREKEAKIAAESIIARYSEETIQKAPPEVSRSPPRPVDMPDLFHLRTFKTRARIAVVAHIYYPDLWPELADAIGNINEPYDLFASVIKGTSDTLVPAIKSRFPNANVFIFPNRGRDILPFMSFIQSGVLFKYEVICKVHTKKSQHRVDGDNWRKELLAGILGSREKITDILQAFRADPDLGLVVSKGHIYGTDPSHWAGNLEKVYSLGSRIGITKVPTEGKEALFPGGSIYWIRPFILRTLLGLKIAPEEFEEEPLPPDGAVAHAVERLIGLICHDSGFACAESADIVSADPDLFTAATPEVKVFAYYLPQYHPIPENDLWWGKGFTEWTNVARARPSFENHRQPRLPADTGFYDLRLPEVAQQQASLAENYGINGFCYYYYWFDGRKILEMPLERLLASGKPNFPFMICWANEPWTRNWDGLNKEILIPQDYEDGWCEKFAHDAVPLLNDPRYLRIDGQPMLLIYRVLSIPDPASAIAKLRSEFAKLDLPNVHISGARLNFGGEAPPEDPTSLGLDSWFEFPPHMFKNLDITSILPNVDPAFSGAVYSYRYSVDKYIEDLAEKSQFPRFRAIMAGWDNTARRQLKAYAFHGASPALFRKWLRALILEEQSRGGDGDKVIFINAWNEWAEGTYLEPDGDYGHAWLEAVASAKGLPFNPGT